MARGGPDGHGWIFDDLDHQGYPHVRREGGREGGRVGEKPLRMT